MLNASAPIVLLLHGGLDDLSGKTGLAMLRYRSGPIVAVIDPAHAGADLSDYNLRRIGSELEGTIRQLLQGGQLRYNPDCRVLNYSMGLPQAPQSA